MSLRPIKVAVQYLFGACAIAFFVTLLTFIFSFLGTIFCAALAGMMLGAFKNFRWQSLPFSFLFPAVIVGVLRVTRAELAPNQVLVLALAAFGSFWLTYGAAAFLLAFERKNPPALVAEASLHTAPPTLVPGSYRGGAELLPVVETQPSSSRPDSELSLEVLEGKWLFERPVVHNGCPQKVLEISQENAVLSVTEQGGRVSLLARCRVKMDGWGGRQTLTFEGEGNGSSDEFLVCI